MSTALVLSYWDLSDPAFGGGRRAHALLRALGPDVLLVQPRAVHPEFRTEPYRPDFGRRKVGINWGMFNFRWPGTTRLVRRLVREEKPAVAVLTSMWGYHPLRALPELPKVLDAHDVNAVAVGERFGTGHPFTRLVRSVEARAVRGVNHVFCCSEPDRDRFIRLYGIKPDRISVVPNGVDTERFPPGRKVRPVDDLWQSRIGDRTALLFMGKLDYQPNRAALDFLQGTLLPRLESSAPDRFRLLVCGGPVPSGPHHASAVFAGRLPSATLDTYLQAADLCLAPVFTGSGTRLKILEYLAAEGPVVATPKAAEGLDCRAGQELVLAEADAFADAVLRLADDSAESQRLGRAGREFVSRHYDWSRAIAPQWRRVLDRWMTARPIA